MKVMKRIALSIITLLFVAFFASSVYADGGLNAYYKLGKVKGDIATVAEKVKLALTKDNFEILGEYNPAKNPNYYVIAFTRADLKKLAIRVKDRGALASVLKVSLIADDKEMVEVCLLNPEYMFYSYLRHEITPIESDLIDISMDVKLAIRSVGTDFVPFGIGNLTESDLKDYRFMPRDPGFTEPVVAGQFPNFNKGLLTIRNSLAARKGVTIGVYEVVFEEEKVAVFGVGLLDPEKDLGEAKILGQLGPQYIASLPYEIILVNNVATILPGKFRFPLFHPGISMAELRKIYLAHRGIEETMKSLAK